MVVQLGESFNGATTLPFVEAPVGICQISSCGDFANRRLIINMVPGVPALAALISTSKCSATLGVFFVKTKSGISNLRASPVAAMPMATHWN